MSTIVEPPSRPAALAATSSSPTQSFFEDPLRIRTMLVPIDLSEESYRALGAEDTLDKMVNFLPLVGISGETQVTAGVPIDKLTEETARPDVDMVIMSTHGYTGLRHALLGSVTEQLVRRANCPVLVVPSHRRAAGD